MIQNAMEDEITGSFYHGLTVHAGSVVVATVSAPEHSVAVVHVVEHDTVEVVAAVPVVQITVQDECVCDSEQVFEDVDDNDELPDKVILPEGSVPVGEGVGVSGGW